MLNPDGKFTLELEAECPIPRNFKSGAVEVFEHPGLVLLIEKQLWRESHLFYGRVGVISRPARASIRHPLDVVGAVGAVQRRTHKYLNGPIQVSSDVPALSTRRRETRFAQTKLLGGD